jgi:hypothetical protein
MNTSPKPLYARSWTLRLVRSENRIARRLKRLSEWFSRDAKRRVDNAVDEWKEAHPIV